MLATFLIASYMTVAAGNCCTVSVDFAKSAGPIRPLNGVNNAPCHVGTNDWEKIHAFERAGIPFMRTHDTVGAWGGAHYVDIPNVFPDFNADENDPKNYDFVFTDRYLANVVKAGTEIFYRLGVTIENYWRIKRYTTNPPKDFRKWARICEHVVRHYNEGWADGYKWNIRYWEIWNEPDNPSMWSGTMEQFLDLYEVSAKHLKRCFPEIKVGGFGSCGFYGLNHAERSGAAGAEWGYFDDFIRWYDALLARCGKNSVPLDFFSFHLYTDDPREHKLHTDYAQGKLDEYGLKSTELINDEWNSMILSDNWSEKSKGEAYGKESHEAAAYVAAVLSVMQYETALSKAMFYDACPSRSYGTLFHSNGKTAPAYEAFLAFNELKKLGTAVEVASTFSNVYALAAKGADGRQRVLLSNWTDQARAVTLRLDKAARYQVSRTDEFHARLLPTGEAVADGDTIVIPWKGMVFLDRMVAQPPVARTARPKPSASYRSAKPAIAPGKVKVCMDWDDSCFTDFRLAELCRKYKAKVTFNITPREHADHCYMQRETTERNGVTYRFKSPEGFDRAQTVSIPYLTNKDFKYCYEGFKIAAHLNFPTGDSAEELDCCRQLMEEFLAIAPDVTGQDGFGIVWSGGRWSPGIVKLAKELGFRYCRGANTYEKPGKWGEWTIQPTTYWSEPPEKFWAWYELAKRRGDVFWFWGHTQDLGYDDAIWARLEGIIKRISEDPDAEWIDVGDLVKGAAE